jgi:uncharacterized delta-60 repeat protein
MWPFTFRKARPRTSDRPRRRPSYRPRLEPLEDRCLLSAGALDPTFGAGAGYVTTATGGGGLAKVLVQPSGNIVVAGEASIPVTTTTTTKHGGTTTTTTNLGVFGAATYNPDGSLDTAFGSGGIVRQPFAGNSGGGFRSAALEPTGTTGDSKILLAGSAIGQNGLALMRLNANGTLDTTFGSNGQVITPFQTSGSTSGHQESARGIAVTSTGQILVVGDDNLDTVLLARYNPDGSLDATFGSGGEATTVFSTPINVRGMALQPDGKFVVVGIDAGEGMVLRYNANGSLDSTFGSGGVVTTAVPFGSPSSSHTTRFNDLAIYPNAGTANDGKIIAVGMVHQAESALTQFLSEWAAVRYHPDGSLDTTFGNGTGSVVFANPQVTPPDEGAGAVAIESDGKPIIAGNASSGGKPSYSQVARLNVDGSLDATFGNGGLVTTAIGNFTTGSAGSFGGSFSALAIQPDGKILAAGYASVSGGGNEWSLARYLPSEPQIGSFTASPNPVASGSSVTLTAANLTDGNAGSSITQVAFYLDSNGDGILEPGTDTLLGYATQTSPGVWTLTFSTANWAAAIDTLFAQARDSYGVLGDPLALSLQVT